ncbi:MAG: Mfa1 family fimbria major subunit [Alloprevotella sp.]|nr:Mfa1 family fimbria major subunit [Alloprevotella sp.]
MKKQFLLAFGLASMMLAGCSDSDNVADGGNTPDPNATGYLSVRVALPSTSGYAGRAESDFTNDQYKHGEVDEYKVHSIQLICFDNSDFVLKHFTYDDGLASTVPPSTPNGITTEITLPVQDVPQTVSKILVLVNYPESVGTGSDFPSIVEGTTTWSQIKDTKFASNTNLIGGAEKNKFFMSNTTLSNGTKTTLLVDVNPKKTQAEAMANPVTVNVERAVGKVSISHDTESSAWTNWRYKLSATGFVDDEVTFENWVLDNTNKETYVIRHYDSSWETLCTGTAPYVQRFYGTSTNYTGNSGNTEHRTYWAKDLNYGGTGVGTFNDTKTAEQITTGMEVADYCLENTFDVNNMKSSQTTRVLLKAKYTPNSIKAALESSPDKNWYRVGSSLTAYTSDGINTLIGNALTAEGIATGVTMDVNRYNAGENNFDAANFTGWSTDGGVKTKQLDCVKRTVGKITCFEDGYCYYEVRVQHFGSKYTPWGEETGAPGTGSDRFYDYITSSSDASENMHYLGRYGIVRNNWYQLELGKVSAPGSPTVPELSNKADDEQKYYLQATVKIMDWAVRKQSVDL